MKLIVQLKLLPTHEQVSALRATLERANAAANALSHVAWETQTLRQYDLHKLAYADTRARTGLSAQLVVRLIAKVADAYKLDEKRQRVFRPHGSIAYDDRILRYFPDAVSIWTVEGRQRIPFVCGERQRAMLAARQGESDLVSRGGEWYLLATVNVIEPPEGEPADYLGVDMGIVNVATDSDGTIYSGAMLNGLRHRHRRLRAKLQAKGTRAAKRLLIRRKRKESRFATNVNHTISKRIVTVAQGTGRGIALENLHGIRDRVRLRRTQRVTLHSWSFAQLQSFLDYKAKMAGVPIVLVDPRNTSRTCPACGHIAKENRKSQASFLCVSCSFAGHADTIAAGNISRRAVVMLPHLTPAIGDGVAVKSCLL